jgi:hypothetical protein
VGKLEYGCKESNLWWLEDDKCPVGAGNIYIELDKFKKLCNELSVQCSDRLLEAYEKHGLFYPIFRINRPKDYLQSIFEQNHGTNRFKQVIEVPEEYVNLLKFEHKELCSWNHPMMYGFDKALSEGHPLEQAYKRCESFIVSPSKDTYCNWDDYKVTLEMTSGDTPLKKIELATRHFYSPWQIYLLEESNRKHTRHMNVLINLREGEKYIFNEQAQKLLLARWQDYFKLLWDYRFKENLLFTKALTCVAGNILEGKDSENFHNSCEKIANNTCLQYSFESWMEFLKALCALYSDYQEREKHRLSKCVKRDIRSVIDISMLGFRKTYRDIISDVGTVIGGRSYFYVSPLERIWPEYEGFLKREAKPLMESVIEDYNKEVPDDLKLDKNAVDEIIEHAFRTGNETMLVSILGINQEYFSPSYFGNEGVWSHIRSLAVAVESWVNTLAANTEFRNAIGTLTKNRFGKNFFDLCCGQLQKELGRTNMVVYSYTDLKQFLDKITTIKFNRHSWMKYLIRAYLVRNYVAHHTRLETELFGSTLIELYRSLLFLAFYTWRVKQP